MCFSQSVSWIHDLDLFNEFMNEQDYIIVTDSENTKEQVKKQVMVEDKGEEVGRQQESGLQPHRSPDIHDQDGGDNVASSASSFSSMSCASSSSSSSSLPLDFLSSTSSSSSSFPSSSSSAPSSSSPSASKPVSVSV